MLAAAARTPRPPLVSPNAAHDDDEHDDDHDGDHDGDHDHDHEHDRNHHHERPKDTQSCACGTAQ
eukprot:gene14090-22985_t